MARRTIVDATSLRAEFSDDRVNCVGTTGCSPGMGADIAKAICADACAMTSVGQTSRSDTHRFAGRGYRELRTASSNESYSQPDSSASPRPSDGVAGRRNT